jgi:proteic killer suppression protein
MEVSFADEQLDRLEVDASYTAGHAPEVVRGFRKAIWAIRAAVDIRDLYKGGLRCEKLSGSRSGQLSVRLNKQWRLIFVIKSSTDGAYLEIIEIVDYH